MRSDIFHLLYLHCALVFWLWQFLAFVNAWGAFLTPPILIRNPEMRPAAIAFYQFYGEEGNPNIPAIAAYALLYILPVLLLYLLINWRYGFRFFGGIKQ